MNGLESEADRRTTVLHFAEQGDTSGYFPQLVRFHDAERYRILFATLYPMDSDLRRQVLDHDVACFSTEARSRAGYPLAIARLAHELRRERVDVLHTHLFDPSLVGLAAGRLARTPVRVMTRHYSDYHTRINKRWHIRADKLCTSMAHAVIAVSQHTGAHLVTAEGTPPHKVHVIANGIDFDRVRPGPMATRERLRREFAPNGERLLLVPARLHPEKGHEYLFQALATMRSLRPPVILMVAGRGPHEAAYRRRVAELGCEDSVRFLGFRRDLIDLMAAADLVILPSLAEAFGLVLAEALFIGTPVVATRIGGIPEIVRDGIDGILVPPADSAALAQAIRGLLTDPERRTRLAGSGHDRVAREFQFARMVRSYEALYERLRHG